MSSVGIVKGDLLHWYMCACGELISLCQNVTRLTSIPVIDVWHKGLHYSRIGYEERAVEEVSELILKGVNHRMRRLLDEPGFEACRWDHS